MRQFYRRVKLEDMPNGENDAAFIGNVSTASHNISLLLPATEQSNFCQEHTTMKERICQSMAKTMAVDINLHFVSAGWFGWRKG